MGTDEAKGPGDVVERISQDDVFRKLLRERFDCSHCSLGKSRGSRLIINCLQHMEAFRAELSQLPRKSEKVPRGNEEGGKNSRFLTGRHLDSA